MTYEKLTRKIVPGARVEIKGVPYTIKQHIVWMQHRAGYPYDKWVLVDEAGDDGYRLFIDLEEQSMGFAQIFHHSFREPMPERLEFKGRWYRQTCAEFCTAVKVEGEKVYQEGEGEIWWDYAAEDNEDEGLSLGRSWETWEREDLATQRLTPQDIRVL